MAKISKKVLKGGVSLTANISATLFLAPNFSTIWRECTGITRLSLPKIGTPFPRTGDGPKALVLVIIFIFILEFKFIFVPVLGFFIMLYYIFRKDIDVFLISIWMPLAPWLNSILGYVEHWL